jgi:hypothetical protein
MFEIFPEHNQEENEAQCETDHQKGRGNEPYFKIPPGKKLNDKKEKNAKQGHNDPIHNRVEEGQLSEEEEIKGKIDV